MYSVGALIWISFRPLLRLAIGAASGFIITRADMFPPVAARGASQIILNVTTPALLFSKIVPAFNADNIKVFGPLLLVAVLYEVMGIALAWLIKQFFWVPHRFRYGMLVAGGWNNIGDIPISVIMSVTSMAPFKGTDDQNLSVAYISVFLLVFIVSLFPMGAHRWVAMDFIGPDVEPCDVKEAIRGKRRRMLFMRTAPSPHSGEDPEKNSHPESLQGEAMVEKAADREADGEATARPAEMSLPRLRRLNTVPDDSDTNVPFSDQADETVIDVNSPRISLNDVSTPFTKTQSTPSPAAPSKDPVPNSNINTTPDTTISFHPQPLSRAQLLKTRLKTFFQSLLTAPSIAIFVSFPIALVPQLKALFIPVPGVNMPSAPDGQPPLAFAMDVATFIGNASVPLGLICLGSALARLKIPLNEWTSLPVGAISALAMGKLLLMPVLGVLIVQGLVRCGVIPVEDKVLQFVCIFCSCLPTATTQVYLTQVYSAEGDAQHLSAFLIPQYILMFISMVALTAYTLNLIF